MSIERFDGKVVHVLSPLRIVINLGAENGVNDGDQFIIFSYGPELFDPDTGENLGKLEVFVGRGEVIHAQERMATIEPVESGLKSRIIHDRSAIAKAFDILGTTAPPVIEEIEGPIPFTNVKKGDYVRRI